MRALSRAGGKACLVYRTTEKKQQKEMKVKQKPSGMLSPVCMQCESVLVVRWVLTEQNRTLLPQAKYLWQAARIANMAIYAGCP